MPQYQIIRQSTFVKGVNASTDVFDQPKGTLPKLSNMMLSIRGALRSIFGGQIVASYQGNGRQTGVGALPAGAIKKIVQGFDVVQQLRNYYLLHDGFEPVGAITGLAGAGAGMTGSLTPSTVYNYKVAAIDDPADIPNHGGIGVAAFLNTATGVGDTALTLTWDAVPGAWGYVITGRTPGFDTFLALVINATGPQGRGSGAGPVFNPPITMTYVDDGSATPGAIVTFGAINLQMVAFEQLTNYGPLQTGPYGYDPLNPASILAWFPKGPALQALPPFGGGPIQSNQPFSACGGVVGLTEATPDLNEFANDMIVVLGNGYPPHLLILATGALVPVTNSFQANYPQWAAGVTNLVNDDVVPTVSNGYFYTCTQAGETGSTEPDWTTALVPGQTLVDNQVIWQNAGLVTNSPPPPGAAHAIYYAGSLWVWNTWPSNNADGINGPSALGMSDINNPTSWNPVNWAFIGKDDGSEGMGLAQFTIAEVGIPPTGSLVMFKNFSAYQAIGVFGSPDFSIQAVQTDMGNIAPRSIQFVSGYGIIRLAHLGFALFDGVRDRLISEEIRPYIFSDSPSQTGALPAMDWTYAYLAHAAQAVNPPLYACLIPVGNSNGALTRMCLYDLVLRAWTIVDFPANLTTDPPALIARCISQIRSPGSQPLTLIGSANDTTIFRMFYGDGTWPDGVTLVAWSITTPEVFNSQNSGAMIYLDKLRIRGRYLDGNNITGNPLTVRLDLNGDDAVGGISAEVGLPAYTNSYMLSDNPNGFVVECDINEKVLNAHAIISGSGNVEIDEVAWLWLPQNTTVPPRIT